jgi:hypothetical protein
VKRPLVVFAVRMEKPFTVRLGPGQELKGEPGDYLVAGTQRELYKVDRAIFETIYLPVPDALLPVEVGEDLSARPAEPTERPGEFVRDPAASGPVGEPTVDGLPEGGEESSLTFYNDGERTRLIAATGQAAELNRHLLPQPTPGTDPDPESGIGRA